MEKSTNNIDIGGKILTDFDEFRGFLFEASSTLLNFVLSSVVILLELAAIFLLISVLFGAAGGDAFFQFFIWQMS